LFKIIYFLGSLPDFGKASWTIHNFGVIWINDKEAFEDKNKDQCKRVFQLNKVK